MACLDAHLYEIEYNLKWILDLMERATKTSRASFLVPKSVSLLAF
jgi:hypothetical protein